MPRVAFLTCVFPPYPGGIGIAAKGLAEAARKNGYEIEVFIPRYTKVHDRELLYISKNIREQHKQERDAGIEVTKLFPFGHYGNAAMLPQLVWRLRSFDIIHLFYPFFGAAELLPLIKRTTRAKIIVHHIMDAVATGWLGKIFSFHRRYFLPRILRQADLVLDMSEDFFQGSDFGATRDKWESVPLGFLPLGVDTSLFCPTEKKNHSAPTIIFVGGLDRAHYFKGISILLQSLSILKERGLAFHCLIVGDGDMKKGYETIAGELGLMTGLVTFTGLVPNEKLPDYYRSADIFVMPSTARVESFCLAAAEAQACGLPAIVSDFPGVRATIEDTITGFVAKPNDAVDLAEKLRRLLTDEELRRGMGGAGRQRVVERYDWAVIGELLDGLYRRLLTVRY